jgi:hypothetical protein
MSEITHTSTKRIRLKGGMERHRAEVVRDGAEPEVSENYRSSVVAQERESDGQWRLTAAARLIMCHVVA